MKLTIKKIDLFLSEIGFIEDGNAYGSVYDLMLNFGSCISNKKC